MAKKMKDFFSVLLRTLMVKYTCCFSQKEGVFLNGWTLLAEKLRGLGIKRQSSEEEEDEAARTERRVGFDSPSCIDERLQGCEQKILQT